MTRTNERATNIADALKVAKQYQTNSTGRIPLCYDRPDERLYADSSDLFHFPSVIDRNLLAGFNIPCYNRLDRRHTILRHLIM